jgi:hypothetical protein
LAVWLQLAARSFVGDARAFGGHLVGRRVGEVTHHLPADGWVRVHQPVEVFIRS